MVLASVLLAFLASVSALSVPDSWDSNVDPELYDAHLQTERLVSKYKDIPGLADDHKRSLLKVIQNVEGGAEQLDKAFARLQARADASWVFQQSSDAPDMSLYEVFESKDSKQRLRYTNTASFLQVDSTKQISGYLDYGKDLGNHMFFWFFESRNKPSEDPVVLWLNGGPGCSSLTGLFFELGPSSINENSRPVYNEYSWNNNANIIFVDQPVNAGFSYSDDGTGPTNSVAAERDVYALLELFFQKFPEYAKNGLHIAGESYAGHYIPALGAEIWSHKDRSFDLSSLMIGNGLTDPAKQYTAYADMACGKGGYPSVLEPNVCKQMQEDTPTCIQMIEKCYADESDWSCLPATVYCNNKLFGPYIGAGRSIYDVRMQCKGEECYEDLEYGSKFVNDRSVQKALGVSPYRSFDSCNNRINSEFVHDGDWMRPYNRNITSLLNVNIPVLVYAGDADFTASWLGNERWTRELDWAQGESYQAEPLKPWHLDGKEVGQVRSLGPLTFARIYGGGHMVPHDKPESSLDLFNRWIRGEMYN